MRPTIPRGFRFGILGVAMTLVATACSIEAPDVILSGGEGTGGGGTGVPGATLPPGAVPGGTTGAGTTTGGGGTGTGSVPSATDTSCVGKSTFTGVSGNEVKLGGTFAASGPVSNISGPILRGVQAYFNETNKQGVHGRKIKLVWEDDGWDAQKGRSLIKKLVEQDRVFVLTVVPSSNGLDAAKSYLEQKGVPVFGTSGLIESQFRSPMQWPVGTGSRSASRIGLLDIKQRGAKNAAIIWLDLLAGKEARDAFRDAIPSIMGKKVEDFVTADRQVTLGERGWSSVWASIKSQTAEWQRGHGETANGIPDYVALLIDPSNAVTAMDAAEQIAFKPRVAWGGGAPLFLNLVAQRNWARKTGLLAGTSYFPPLGEYLSSNAAVKSYVNTLRNYYGSGIDVLNPYLEGGYAGAALTVEILKRAGSCLTRDKVISAANSISGYSAAGLTQPLTYTRSNHYGNTSGLVLKVQANGQWAVASQWYEDPSPGK